MHVLKFPQTKTPYETEKYFFMNMKQILAFYITPFWAYWLHY